MESIDSPIGRMVGASLTDIASVGYIDHSEAIARFAPLYDRLYLVLSPGQAFLEMTAFRERWIDIADSDIMVPPFPIDEDDEFCVSSLGALIFGDVPRDNIIARVSCFTDDNIGALATVRVRRLHVRLLMSGGIERDLVFDPENIDGLRIVDSDSLVSWQEDQRVQGENITLTTTTAAIG